MENRYADVFVEWDDSKNRMNIKKHGISFDSAALVFSDLNRLEFYDEWHSVIEDRYITIGVVEEVLFVVYTYRNERIRLISARIATEGERRLYYGSYQKENKSRNDAYR